MLRIQNGSDFEQYLVQARLFCGDRVLIRAYVFMMRMREDMRVMWGIIVTEDVYTGSRVGISIMYAQWITHFGTHNLVDV